MVRGAAKRAVIVRPADTRLFEQAAPAATRRAAKESSLFRR